MVDVSLPTEDFFPVVYLFIRIYWTINVLLMSKSAFSDIMLYGV